MIIVQVEGAQVQVIDRITWTTELRSTPSKVTFGVLAGASIREGATVKISVDGKPLFLGYVFTLHYDNETISVTAYDQLRYLKNKDTYVYKNKTASQVIKMIAEDFNLTCGSIANTAYPLTRTEDNKTLYDIIETALDATLISQKELYVFYDNYGKLTLKRSYDMKLTNFAITDINTEEYGLTSSIDDDTYNQVKLYFDNTETGKRDVYVEKDSSTIRKWGILQYSDEIQDPSQGKSQAQNILKAYNLPRRTLTLRGIQTGGNMDIRAGAMMPIRMKVGDIQLNEQMLVASCRHYLSDEEKTADITICGGKLDG